MENQRRHRTLESGTTVHPNPDDRPTPSQKSNASTTPAFVWIRVISGPSNQTTAHESHQSTRIKTGAIGGKINVGTVLWNPGQESTPNPDNRPIPPQKTSASNPSAFVWIRVIIGPSNQTTAHESHQSTRMKTGANSGESTSAPYSGIRDNGSPQPRWQTHPTPKIQRIQHFGIRVIRVIRGPSPHQSTRRKAGGIGGRINVGGSLWVREGVE